MTKHKFPDLEHMRESFFLGNLTHEQMGMSDYERLFMYETEYKSSNRFILEFCLEGVQKYKEYNSEFKKRPFSEIIAIAEKEKNRKRIFMLKTIVAEAGKYFAATIILFASIELLGEVFDFNLYGDIGEEAYVSTFLPYENFFESDGEISATLTYNNLNDMGAAFKRFLSPALLNNYSFSSAVYNKAEEKEDINFYFYDEESNIISLRVKNKNIFDGLPEGEEYDDSYREIFYGKHCEFEITKNEDAYQVVWFYDRFNFYMKAFLPLDEVKMILENYY